MGLVVALLGVGFSAVTRVAALQEYAHGLISLTNGLWKRSLDTRGRGNAVA